jgi:hypothetical protein
MNILTSLKRLKEALMGRELTRTLVRNAEAADELDRAVREMLRK